MEVNFDFDLIKKDLYKLYINNLIKTGEKNEINTDILFEIIDKLSEPKEIKKISSSSSLSNSDTNNDDYLYQKPWIKLNLIHKKIKIKEFVNTLEIIDENEKQIIKDKLVSLVDTKILTKKDTVIYDSAKAKVISIPLLQFKSGKYII